MSVKIYIPCDAAALSMGANHIADAIAKAVPEATIIRNGSRGMLWLEPLIEIETKKGRVAYGPVSASDIAGLITDGMLNGKDHGIMPWTH